MRERGLSLYPILLAACAVAALLVHLLVPLGQFTVPGDAGAQDRWLYPGDLHMVGDDRVAGTGAAAMLTGLILTSVGSLAFAALSLLPGDRLRWRLAAGLAAGIGAAMTLVSQALWTGRLVSSAIHAFIGSDGPPGAFEAEGWAGPDVGASAWMLSPAIVLVLVLGILYFLGRTWIAQIPDTRDLVAAAVTQHKAMILIAVTVALALIVPWSAVQLQDSGDDQDMFFWSPYDVHMIQDASESRAMESSEFGIMEYRGLASLLIALAWVGAASVVALLVTVAGAELDAKGQGVAGRLMENASFLAALGLAYLAIAPLLGAFWLHTPNDFHDATVTAIPLIALIPLAFAARPIWEAVRRLMAEDQDLVADDFPEPIIYDSS